MRNFSKPSTGTRGFGIFDFSKPSTVTRGFGILGIVFAVMFVLVLGFIIRQFFYGQELLNQCVADGHKEYECVAMLNRAPQTNVYVNER